MCSNYTSKHLSETTTQQATPTTETLKAKGNTE